MDEDGARPSLEEDVIAALQRGATFEGARILVAGAGADLFAYMRALARDEELAEEAYSVFCEDLLSGIGTFDTQRGRLLAWSHVVARNALRRTAKREQRHRRRRANESAVAQLAEATRIPTARYLKTRARTTVEEARRQLPPEDDALLVLRVDERLSWKDIAVALEMEPTAQVVARLRKRYQRIKEQLRSALAEAGLLEPEA